MSLIKTILSFIFILALVVVGFSVVILEEGSGLYQIDSENRPVIGESSNSKNLENKSVELSAENILSEKEISGTIEKDFANNEISKINPFKVETNPFKDAYKNPFE